MRAQTSSNQRASSVGDGSDSFIRSIADARNNLLRVEYRGRVTPDVMRDHLIELDGILAGLEDGFVVLTDLSRLEAMDRGCSVDLSRVMETYAVRHVAAVVRIIPDPTRDIGFSILSLFHYPQNVRIVTCGDAAEAERLLAEWAGNE